MPQELQACLEWVVDWRVRGNHGRPAPVALERVAGPGPRWQRVQVARDSEAYFWTVMAQEFYDVVRDEARFVGPEEVADVESTQDGFPVLLAYRRDTEKPFLSCYCPGCGAWHHHGCGAGHRVAHCSSTASPFKDRGYVLKDTELGVSESPHYREWKKSSG